MKIAYFGTAEFSVNILEGLMKFHDISVELVVSQADKPVGRNKEIIPTLLKVYAEKKNISLEQPEKIKNNRELFDKLSKLDLDFIVVVAYGKIIPLDILQIPRFGCINVHGSLLPLYRGASPIQESIKNGDKDTGLTIMYMSSGMDEGDILNTQKIKIDASDKTTDIFKKFAKIGPDLLYTTLQEVVSGEKIAIKQDETKASYCGKISKENGVVKFTIDSGVDIWNKYRAYTTWPGIYTYFEGKKLNLEEIEIEDYIDGSQGTGSVIQLSKKKFGIICKDNKICVLMQVKLEGKKSMDILSFVNGNKGFLGYTFE